MKTENIIDIEDRLQKAANGLDFRTMQLFYSLMERRTEAARQILQQHYKAEDIEYFLDEMRDNIIKIFGL